MLNEIIFAIKIINVALIIFMYTRCTTENMATLSENKCRCENIYMAFITFIILQVTISLLKVYSNTYACSAPILGCKIAGMTSLIKLTTSQL